MKSSQKSSSKSSKSGRTIIIVAAVILAPLLIAGLFHLLVLNTESRTIAEAKNAVQAMGLTELVREDTTKGCHEDAQGFALVGYSCSYSSYQYYSGPPPEDAILSSLKEQGFEIHRISKEPGFFELQALKSGHLTVNIHYRKEFIADSGDKSTYPPTLWREHVYQVYVGNQKTVL